MDNDAFKFPLYWLSMFDNLTDEETGIIIKQVFIYAATLVEAHYISRLSDKGNEILKKCIADIKYQKLHPHSYRVVEERTAIRRSGAYCAWRAAVYERDHYTCQNCGKVGGRLNAHHIKSFARNPGLRLDVNNGITLCEKCHKLAHKRGFKYAE